MKTECEWETEGDDNYGIEHSTVLIRVRRHDICTYCVAAVLQKTGTMIMDEDIVRVQS